MQKNKKRRNKITREKRIDNKVKDIENIPLVNNNASTTSVAKKITDNKVIITIESNENIDEYFLCISECKDTTVNKNVLKTIKNALPFANIVAIVGLIISIVGLTQATKDSTMAEFNITPKFCISTVYDEQNQKELCVTNVGELVKIDGITVRALNYLLAYEETATSDSKPIFVYIPDYFTEKIPNNYNVEVIDLPSSSNILSDYIYEINKEIRLENPEYQKYQLKYIDFYYIDIIYTDYTGKNVHKYFQYIDYFNLPTNYIEISKDSYDYYANDNIDYEQSIDDFLNDESENYQIKKAIINAYENAITEE